jgi:hypothetical protein
MDDLSHSYRILGLESPVSKDELKRAYRELVKVWHPDRFGHDEQLQRSAEQKLKEINGAYEILLANLFAESLDEPDAAAPSPPPPASGETAPATGKRAVFWVCLIVVLTLSALIWGMFWNRDRTHPTRPIVTESTPQLPSPSQAEMPTTAHITSNAISDTARRSEDKAPLVIAPVISNKPPDSAATNPTKEPSTVPGRIIADHVFTVVDDFVVDVFHNGNRVPDRQRTLLTETYGACSEKIDVTMREGDWLVFNVVNNRFRWDGQSCFLVAGMQKNGAIAFVSELQSGRWSCCDDPSDAPQFIASPDYLSLNRPRRIARLWGDGPKLMKGMVKNWQGQPIWGTNSSTWIKFRATHTSVVK